MLPLGRTMDGTLSRTDATLNEKGRFQVFQLDLKPSQRYSIVMRADDFDSFLSVACQVNELTDYLASDDDGAGGNNARVEYVFEEDGEYIVRANNVGAGKTGADTIRLDRIRLPRPPAPPARRP